MGDLHFKVVDTSGEQFIDCCVQNRQVRAKQHWVGTLSQGPSTTTWSAGLEPTAAAESIQARATALTAGVINQSTLALFLLDARLALSLAYTTLHARMATEQDHAHAPMLTSCQCMSRANRRCMSQPKHQHRHQLLQGDLTPRRFH